jgi:hypothetical protein
LLQTERLGLSLRPDALFLLVARSSSRLALRSERFDVRSLQDE